MPHIPLALFERILTQVDPELARDLRQFEQGETPASLLPKLMRGKLSEAQYELGLAVQDVYQKSTSLEQFARNLEDGGILIRPSLSKGGVLGGFRFTNENASVIGSQIGLPASSFLLGRAAYSARDHETLMRAYAEAHDTRFGPLSKLKAAAASKPVSEVDVRNHERQMLKSIVSTVLPGATSLSELTQRLEDNGVHLKIKRRERSGAISSAKLEYRGQQFSARALGLHRNTLKWIEKVAGPPAPADCDAPHIGSHLPPRLKETIQGLNDGTRPLDEDAALSLKSGHDFWSDQEMPVVIKAIYEAYGKETVDAVLDDLPASNARSAARWMGRGLQPDVAGELIRLRTFAWSEPRAHEDDVIDLEDPQP